MTTPANMGIDIMRFARLEMREVQELCIEGRAPVIEHLRGPNHAVRAGALLTMLDTAGGLCGGLASLPDGWVMSTNMSARRLHRDPTGPLRIASRVMRKGRNTVVTTVEIGDEATGTAVMEGVLTSAILVPEGGPPQWERPMRMAYPADVDYLSMERWLDARVVDELTIEIDLRDALRNPWGILHGGVTAALVDACVEHATGGALTGDVVLHYLAPNRTGPIRARATLLGRRSDGHMVRVEVRDVGSDRVTAVAVTTAAV
jgi:acyl-coenzyme A thioesterase PaaI-like protein